jgi:hypothetical protein
MRRWPPVSLPSSPCFTPHMLAKSSENSIFAKGCIGDKPCLVNVDTRASVTVTSPYISTVLSEGNLSWLYILQTVSTEILPVSKEVLVELTLGHSALHSVHRRINPGAGHLASLRHDGRFEELRATAGPRRDVITASCSPNAIIPRQWRGDSRFM